mmetsp:Transcript_65716/g.186547  ORF Transcript_65716/g.186547 Transcript_65716/m.186547 type:complete len:299 (-) Transcript_65716:698-1594(-)
MPVDPRLAGVDLHKRGRVLYGPVAMLECLLRFAYEVKVLRRSHQREEEARGRLLLFAGGAIAGVTTGRRAEKRIVLGEATHVLQEQLLHELGLARLEVERPDHPEKRRHAPTELLTQVLVQLSLEADPRHKVELEPLQRVRTWVLTLQLLEKPADLLLLRRLERAHRFQRFAPALMLPLPDRDALRDSQCVLRGQPAPDGHALGVQRGGEAADRGWQRGCTLGAFGDGGRRCRPEAVEAGLAGHEGEDVDLVLGVDAHKPAVNLLGLAETLEEEAEPALSLHEPELVHNLPFVLLQLF